MCLQLTIPAVFSTLLYLAPLRSHRVFVLRRVLRQLAVGQVAVLQCAFDLHAVPKLLPFGCVGFFLCSKSCVVAAGCHGVLRAGVLALHLEQFFLRLFLLGFEFGFVVDGAHCTTR